MPSVSKKQEDTMRAAAHSAPFARKIGIPQAVAKEFNEADKGKSETKKKAPNHSKLYTKGVK